MNTGSTTILKAEETLCVLALWKLSQLLSSFCVVVTYNNICKTLLDDLRVINVNILKLSETALTDLLLYGKASFDKIQYKIILTASIKFIVDSKVLLVL